MIVNDWNPSMGELEAIGYGYWISVWATEGI